MFLLFCWIAIFSKFANFQDELLGNNILREINGEPIIKIPSPEESNKYFTPISPAAKTGHGLVIFFALHLIFFFLLAYRS